MPIPELNEHGLLPEGLHECTLDEVVARFGQFTVSDRRVHLVSRLRDYFGELGSTNLAAFVVVDGSFVTGKEEPGDVDLLVALRSDVDLGADFRPFEYNVISKRRVRTSYPFDLLVAPEQSEAYERYLDLFSQVKGSPDLRKGLLRVKP